MQEKENQDLEQMASALDPEILAAMEQALDEVEAEQNERAKEVTKATLLYEYIHKRNKQTETLVCKHTLLSTQIPGLTTEDMTELLAHMENYPELNVIAGLRGTKDDYYYDSTVFTARFAQVQAMIEERDLLALIAKAARHDCKTYPRPLRMAALKRAPYYCSEEEVLNALARMESEEAYQDIKVVTASNGVINIYSTEYMSERYAKALCEQQEVEWELNQ